MDTQEQNQMHVEKPAESSAQTKKPMINTPAAIVTAGVVIALALLLSGKGSGNVKNNQVNDADGQQQEQVVPPENVSVRPTDHVRGDLSKAEVVIVEYSDSDCPYCQRFHVSMQDAVKKYGNKVAWVYRHFPLSIHPNANNEALALECVASLGGNDAFWSYLDQVIDITVAPDKSAPILSSMASALGVDAGAFKTCVASKDIKAIIDNQSAEAQTLGAQGTPYSIAFNKDGKQVVIPGAVPFEELQKTIDGLLK